MASLNYDFLIIPLIIIFFIARVFLRKRKGSVYSVRGIFLRPILYILISIAFLFILSLEQDLLLIVAILLGTLIGLILGKRSDMFEKNGKIMYKRSNEITILWLVGFVVRILIDLYYNPALSSSTINLSKILIYEQTIPILFISDILLALTAGLLLGEAIILYKNHAKMYSK